jgi:osmotically-inducible protein OsmY
MPSDDEIIKKEIDDRLYWDQRVDSSDVEVEVSDGNVRLWGEVPTYTAKTAAWRNAVVVPGVVSVVDDLEVTGARGIARPADQDIKARVENSLDVNAEVDTSGMEVSVDHGKVTLEGTVSSYWQKVWAQRLAGVVTGVLDVSNDLVVTPTDSIEDKIIGDGIAAALRENGVIDENTVDVAVEDGMVNLSGTVPSVTAYMAAEDIACYTPGVKEVTNEIDIVRP